MLIDGVSSDIMRELARIHKRKIAPLKKALESAIVRAVSDYECAQHALLSLKQCLFVLGKASEWTALLESLRLQYPKKRNLMAILDELA